MTNFKGGRAVVFVKITQQPHLDRSRYSSAQSVSSGEECGMFSDTGIIDLTKDTCAVIW